MWYTQSLIQKIVSSSSSHSREDMWEKIQIAMILRKIFIAKCFLQYFQCLLDMPFFDSIYIPILKNRHRIYMYIYIYILIQSIAYCINIYQVPLCCPRCSCILIYIFSSKYYWLSNLFLFQGIKYLLLTWSSFVWCHAISSFPSQMLVIMSSLFDVLCQCEFRDSEKCCECVKMVFASTDMSWD